MNKQIIIISFLLTFCTNIFAQNIQKYYFEIDGTINADSGSVYLDFNADYIQNQQKELIAKVENHKFTFSGYISEPQSINLLYDANSNLSVDFVYMSKKFILDKGKQTIDVDINANREMPDVKNKIMSNESPLMSEFYKPMTQKWDLFYKESDSLSTIYNYKIPEEVKVNRKKIYDELCSEDDHYLLAYSEKHPDSYLGLWKLIDLLTWGYVPVYDTIYNNFSGQLKNGYAGQILKQKIQACKLSSVGNPFPLINCVDSTNQPFSLDGFYKNKYTLVDFWYTQCGPCRRQFNSLRDLYNQYHLQGFEIVGVSVDKEEYQNDWKQLIVSENLIWQHYWDKNGTEAHRLVINKFPTNFLIDSTGKIIAKDLSMEELKAFLEGNLNQ